MTSTELLETIRTGWLNQLAVDAASLIPLPDYSIDGQTVSRAQWRDSMLKNVQTIGATIQMLEPYELRGSAG